MAHIRSVVEERYQRQLEYKRTELALERQTREEEKEASRGGSVYLHAPSLSPTQDIFDAFRWGDSQSVAAWTEEEDSESESDDELLDLDVPSDNGYPMQSVPHIIVTTEDDDDDDDDGIPDVRRMNTEQRVRGPPEVPVLPEVKKIAKDQGASAASSTSSLRPIITTRQRRSPPLIRFASTSSTHSRSISALQDLRPGASNTDVQRASSLQRSWSSRSGTSTLDSGPIRLTPSDGSRSTGSGSLRSRTSIATDTLLRLEEAALQKDEEAGRRAEDAKKDREDARRLVEDTRKTLEMAKRVEREAEQKAAEASRKEEAMRLKGSESERKEASAQRKVEEVKVREAEVRRKEDAMRQKEDVAKRKESEALLKRVREKMEWEKRVRQREDDLRQQEESARKMEREAQVLMQDVQRREAKIAQREADIAVRERDARLREEALREGEASLQRRELARHGSIGRRVPERTPIRDWARGLRDRQEFDEQAKLDRIELFSDDSGPSITGEKSVKSIMSVLTKTYMR
ncbi:hypothetical protein BV25DRAFT_1165893 [Artomyces pyxidatus]|uniref:Uncharacterized protein n=1 Tax=Artomyces pyxidatus TaxID=48021 RepID=A0ACB8SRE2_9AGAM|nr:hypothetical protein BV25DRAFT_1165893 [Artomyces pyxidatus]